MAEWFFIEHMPRNGARRRLAAFRRWWGRADRRHHFPLFPYDPADCDFVVMRIEGPPTDVAINGKRLSLEHTFGRGVYQLAPDSLEPAENIVYTREPVRQVALFPGLRRGMLKGINPPWGYHDFRLKGIGGSYCQKVPAQPAKTHPRPALSYLLNARNTFRGSRFRGTFFACYDVASHTYRLNSWIWCSAAVVRALLEEYEHTGDAQYQQIAQETGDRLMDFQEKEGPERGGLEVRWDLSTASPSGIRRWLAPNDAAFIGAYAFLPLYEQTGEKRYLEAAVAIGAWVVARGMAQTGRLWVGCDKDTGQWDRSWVYVDCGFTATLFGALHRATGEARWVQALRLFVDDYIPRFQSPQGYLYKEWREPNRVDIKIYSRGQAWALDGLLAAYRCLKEPRYLEAATRCADFLLPLQNPNGSWNYIADAPASGEDNKATPILAYHLLELYQITGKESYRAAAEKALGWCRAHQYRGADTLAYGGIHAHNAEGCIVGVRDTDSIFSYAVAFYLLAERRRELL